MARASRTSLSSMLVDAQRWLAAAERSSSGCNSGLPRSHTLVFSHLDAEGTRPAEIARRAGISRQAVGQTVAQMKSLGLVKLAADPTNRRARLGQPTAEGRQGPRRTRAGTPAGEKDPARRGRPAPRQAP